MWYSSHKSVFHGMYIIFVHDLNRYFANSASQTWKSTLFLKHVEAEKLNDDSLTSSEQLNQYESARRSKNTPAVKSPCFGYSIVELSAAAEWLLSGWSWQNIVCLYVKIWTIKKVNQERLMNANSHRSGNKSLVPVLSRSLSLLQRTWCPVSAQVRVSRWSTLLCWLSRSKLRDSASNTWRTRTTDWRYKSPLNHLNS